jgi:hypothetical protein
MRWVGHREMSNEYKIFIVIREGKTSLRRTGRRLEGNIKMYLREI